MRATSAILLLSVLTAATVLADDRANEPGEDERHGYVLKAGQGEKVFDSIIKASPDMGTQGGVMMIAVLTPPFSTGLHIHLEADEFFYVLSGQGTATLGKDEIAFGPGDVIFVPAGQDHKLVVADGAPVEVLTFLDKPGFDQECRELYRKYPDWKQVTLEDVNAIARKYGTIYKTFE